MRTPNEHPKGTVLDEKTWGKPVIDFVVSDPRLMRTSELTAQGIQPNEGILVRAKEGSPGKKTPFHAVLIKVNDELQLICTESDDFGVELELDYEWERAE